MLRRLIETVTTTSDRRGRKIQRDMNEQQRRPVGISVLSFFFLFGVLASGLTALILLVPGTPMDVLWGLNPRAREGLLPLGRFGVVLMGTVCLACAAAATGLWRRRPWGFWTAVVVLVMNLVGDAINSLAFSDWRTLIGVPIAGLMILYLFGKRRFFEVA